MLFPLEKLLQGKGVPTCIQQDTKIRDALAIMIQNDYSQLPIVDKSGYLIGVISEQTIARTYYHMQAAVSLLDLTVDHCQTRPVTMSPEDDLFDALDRLKDVYAIIIVEDKKPVGILTDYDTTNFFRDLSEDLVRVEDIETTLRQYIEAVCPNTAKLSAALMIAFGPDRRDSSKPAKEYEGLTFGEHIQLIRTDKNWGKFSQVFEPKEMFFQLMEQVRQIRNKLAHFRGRLDPVQRDALKRALHWIEARPKLASSTSSQLIHYDPATFESIVDVTKGKYERLRDWLMSQDVNERDIMVSFQDIESVLGESLPPSARQHRSWWANDSTSHKQSITWLEAGWRVEEVDLSDELVVFGRLKGQG